MTKILPALLTVILILSGCTKGGMLQLTAEQLEEKKDSCYRLISTVIHYENTLYPATGDISQVDWMLYHQPTDDCYYAGQVTQELINIEGQPETVYILYITQVSTLQQIYRRVIGGPDGLPISTYDDELVQFNDTVQSMRNGQPL